MPNILIIDDDRAVCTSLELLLKRSGMQATAVHHPRDTVETIKRESPDVALLDMNFAIETSGKQGLKTLQLLQEQFPDLPVILITGWATVELAVEGMKLGAVDFIAKPWDNKRLLTAIRHQLQVRSTGDHPAETASAFDQIIGQDPRLLEVLRLARRVAPADAGVLITGESGTGKELVAEAIHAESKRARGPFVKVNLGGIANALFESELFGHKKGAFTDAIADRVGRFELAHMGTIFLDEIGDLSLESQVKLLRVLQEGTYEALGDSHSRRTDVRVISATNKPLENMIRDGQFREDLYYRINLVKLALPPLRERPGDIPLLADYFVQRLKRLYDRPNLHLSQDAKTWLQGQAFPGNIRELQNLVERTVLLHTEDELLGLHFQTHYQKGQLLALPENGIPTLESMEVELIRRAMQLHGNSITEAAKTLGITRAALYRRLEKHRLNF